MSPDDSWHWLWQQVHFINTPNKYHSQANYIHSYFKCCAKERSAHWKHRPQQNHVPKLTCKVFQRHVLYVGGLLDIPLNNYLHQISHGVVFRVISMMSRAFILRNNVVMVFKFASIIFTFFLLIIASGWRWTIDKYYTSVHPLSNTNLIYIYMFICCVLQIVFKLYCIVLYNNVCCCWK